MNGSWWSTTREGADQGVGLGLRPPGTGPWTELPYTKAFQTPEDVWTPRRPS
jgi:hypothetical protein